ncbi:hypothetical protein F2Q69_00049240 [Brassica cretica]|uniref:Uncharacterized protein n=1 Tax=Brassica cretica TaxID=69181 RepID=A0A8S9Q0N8_BRACR|nr:hypothetical protein F2Q69_00049240 [Brassica cretica]
MTVAQLVQQPGPEHLPYLTPCPKGRRQTWFSRSGNGISAWINNMMYSNLSKGYPTFTHFLAEDQEMWFRQFAQEFTWNPDHMNSIRDAFVHKVIDNYGKQIYEWKKKWLINQTAHTNKHTGEIDDGVVRDVLSLIETQKEDEETRLSQLQTDLDATSTASTNLSRIRINEIFESSVPKKKGRLVGLGHRAQSVPPSAPQPYGYPEVLMDQLKDKDDSIAGLEQKMADQEAGWEATRKNIPRKCIPQDIPTTTSSEYSEGLSPRNIPTDTLPRDIPTAKVSRNIPTAEVRRNIPIPLFSRNVSEKEDEETRLSQLQTDLDATSTASTNLSRIRINEIVESSVPKKKGRLVGLGRRARSVPPSAPQPYVDPEVLMDQLKDKDDRIAALEQKMADQEAGWEATRKQNEQMMEMMKRMYPNEQFP